MGKAKKHNKLYITRSEWINEFGGKKEGDPVGERGRQALPFDCCALSLSPFTHPVIAPSGAVFDLLHIIPFIKKYGVDPTSGEPLRAKDLTRLHFHKNENGKYHCPLTFKVFTAHTHIVAIRCTGHVYAYASLQELCIRAGNWNDPMENTPFTRADLITIQDPQGEKRGWGNFYHVKMDLQEVSPLASVDDVAGVVKSIKKDKKKKVKADAPGEHQSSARPAAASKAVSATYASAAFTCAGYEQKPEVVPVWKSPGLQTKKKAYVRLCTSMGDINVELRTDLVPKTCENFLVLCSRGYYDGTVFHRLIKNFMVQGGDPTGTGMGGQSCWDHEFDDEFKPQLRHAGRGVLSMANSGPNSNKSQFFITFKSCSHLDNKHSVFGSVVGGMDVLGKIERQPTDDDDRPLEEIKLVKAVVFINPFETLEEERAEEEEKEARRQLEENRSIQPEMGQWYSNPTGRDEHAASQSTAVGKYLPDESKVSVGQKRGLDFGGVRNSKKVKKVDPFSRW